MIPDVSVVIPTFNRAASVSIAIESAILTPCTEVIVVDDGSSDETHQTLSAFGSSIVAVYQSNRGVAEARNHGLKIARAPFVKFLDSDDSLMPGALEQQLKEITELPAHGVPVGTLVDINGHPFDDVTTAQNLIGPMEMATRALQVSQPLLRTEKVREVGGFSYSAMAEDFDLFLRLYMRGERFYKTGTPVTMFRDEPLPDRLCHTPLKTRFILAGSMYARLTDNVFAWSDPKGAELRIGLGRHLWSLGRRMARNNLEHEAQFCFELAKRLAGKKAYNATPLMQLMYRFLRPCRVERVAEQLKNLI